MAQLKVSKKTTANEKNKNDVKKPPAGGKKPQKGGNNKDTKAHKEEKPLSDKLIHQIIPFIWIVAALFLLVCYLSRDIFGFKGADNIMGPVGEAIHNILFGLLGWGAFLIPALCVYLGAKWRRLIDRHRVGLKTFLACGLMILAAMFAQVLCVSINDAGFPGLALWGQGADLIGGGIVGGSLGWLCYMGLDVVGSIIVLSAVIIIVACLFVDATPRNIWTWIKYKNKIRRERIERDRERYEAEQLAISEMKVNEKPEEPQEAHEPRERRSLLSLRKKQTDDTLAAPDVPEDTSDAVMVSGGAEETIAEPEPEPIPEPEPAPEPEKKESVLSRVFAEPEPQINANDGDDSAPFEVESEEVFELPEPEEDAVIPWTQPPLELLNEDPGAHADQSATIAETKKKLYQTLESFGVRVKDIGYSIGPTITRYEVIPAEGVRVKQIANLVDDIAMSLATVGVRIEAPIPNKSAVGVEVPNLVRSNVYLRTLIDDDQFWNSSPLTVSLGQDVAGKNVYFDIKKMPHMIIAGTTGAGKSVCINCVICSLLYKNPPDKVKLVMIDPKKVEFNVYQHIPHLYCPIISDPRKAAGALASAVAEMERRYSLVEDVGVRDIDSYNKATANDPDREYLPKLIIIIDELADLMMTAKQDVELFITRIAQKARAVGIHLIIGTQRPSVDVITGLIKANVPSRIACTVKSQVDSRTIIDISGAEKLIGRGDMLFSPVGLSKPMRVQGAFLEDEEVMRVVDFIKDNNEPVSYNSGFMDTMEAAAASMEAEGKKGSSPDFTPANGAGGDEDKFRQALEVAVNEGKISTSLLQRKLSIGYGKAAKIIDEMEDAGYVSAPDGNKPRRVLLSKQEFYEKVLNDDLPSSAE